MMVYRAQEDKGTKRKFEDDACEDGSEQEIKSNKKANHNQWLGGGQRIMGVVIRSSTHDIQMTNSNIM